MIQASCVLLRTTKYRESSLIFDAYSYEQGLLSFIAGGVRKPRARTSASMLQVGNQLELIAYPAKTDLHRLKSARLTQIYEQIPFDVRRMSVMTFCIEVFRNSLQGTEQSRTMYNSLIGMLSDLDDSSGDISLLPQRFLLQLTDPIGIAPYLDSEKPYFDLREGRSTLNNPMHMDVLEGDLLQALISLRQETSMPTLSRSMRSDLLSKLVDYYHLHQPGFRSLKSLDILRTVY